MFNSEAISARPSLDLDAAECQQFAAVLESSPVPARVFAQGTGHVEYLNEHSRPSEVMEARLAIKPQIVRLAAVHGTASHFSEMRRCIRLCRSAGEWRVYESWDNNFHQAIAKATCNKLLISLFDTLNIVRRSTVWGQLRSTKLPPANHGSFGEHDAIYDAIVARDTDQAAELMRKHLKSVRSRSYAAMEQ